MGRIALTTLLPGSSGTVDDAQEIGALPAQRAATAMRIAQKRGAEGPLVYEAEIPVFVGMRWRSMAYGGGHCHGWWRLEVQAPAKPAVIQRGHALVVAEHPYSNGWVQAAPFKRALRRERLDLGNRPFSSPQELITWIEALLYDFWEKGNFLTAGISAPERPSKPQAAVRNLHEQAALVFGICDDFGDAVKALMGTEEVDKLLKDTRKGTLRFWPSWVDLAEPPARADELLYDLLIPEAWELMQLAVCQALAGPDEDSAPWIRQPVTAKVNHIYREHLYNRYRTLVRERRKLVPYDERLANRSHGRAAWEEDGDGE